MVRAGRIPGREGGEGLLTHPARALLFACLLALVGCRHRSEPVMTFTHSTEPLRLSMPATIALPDGRDRVMADETARGFHVYPASGLKRRVAIEAWVELHRGEAPPAGPWPEERRIADRRIHYRVDRSDGGNGGTQYDLLAWEPAPGGYLLYRQGDLVEDPGRPDFDLVWEVAEGTEMAGDR